jgi:transglutaminase/protease-like cytokinesis protein 3
MKKACKGALFASAVLFFLLLSGCASLWEREIYERTTHVVQDDTELSAAALTVNSYETLRSAVISAIRSGESEVDIRVTDYPGELTSHSISALINEIQKWEPIGAYTVDYIVIDDIRSVLSQYIITLYIVYKHDARPDITLVRGRRELESAVHSALLEYLPGLTVEMPYFYARDHDVESMVRAFYYSSPGWAMEYPGVNTGLFPPSDGPLSRIIELALNWQAPPEELIRKADETQTRAALLLSELPDFPGTGEETAAQTVLWLHETLCGAIEYDRDTAMAAAETEGRLGGDPYTAYGALVNGLAVSEGAAMAFKLLCDILGVDSLVVTGSWWGNEHAWNLVKIGEHWYHIAIALDSRGPVPTYEYFLLSDESAMMGLLLWEFSLYPPAAPGPWTLESIREPGIAEGEENPQDP